MVWSHLYFCGPNSMDSFLSSRCRCFTQPASGSISISILSQWPVPLVTSTIEKNSCQLKANPASHSALTQTSLQFNASKYLWPVWKLHWFDVDIGHLKVHGPKCQIPFKSFSGKSKSYVSSTALSAVHQLHVFEPSVLSPTPRPFSACSVGFVSKIAIWWSLKTCVAVAL